MKKNITYSATNKVSLKACTLKMRIKFFQYTINFYLHKNHSFIVYFC